MIFNEKRKAIEYLVIVLISLLSTIGFAQVSHYSITGIELLLPCVFALHIIVLAKALGLWKAGKAELRFSVPVGIVIDVAVVVGSKIDIDSRVFDAFGIKDIVFIALLVPFFVSIVLLLFFSSDAISEKITPKGVVNETSIKKICISMAVMLVCWLPYYLTYYPGGIGNDIFESVNMCLGNIPWTNHHPVFFTALIKFFIVLFGRGGNLNLALGMMVLVQMVVMSFVLSLVIAWMRRRGAEKVICLVTLAFFALHPIMAMYAIYLTKDILFSCFVVLLVLYISDYISAANEGSIKVRHHIILGILAFFTILTRNNGTLVVVMTLLAMFLGIRKMRKQLVVVLIVVMALNALYKGPLWNVIGIEKQSFAESAAIPLTQVAYTIYTDGVFEKEDEAYLEELMPFDKVKAGFEPGYVDTYKFDKAFNTELLDENPGRFMKVWLHGLTGNFGKYVEGYLFETCGYWSYGVTNTVATEGVKENELSIEGTDWIESVTGVSLSKLLAELVLVARKLPILCGLSQMATQILAVVLLMGQYIRRKKKMNVLMLMPLVALWISVMIASPAYCLFRYMFPVFVLWPVIIDEFFDTSK